MEKHLEYSAIIAGKIAELFNEDSESDYKINADEFKDGENLTAFIHALSNVVPCRFYNNITGEDKNLLHFNHTANHLVFQFSKQVEP